MPTTKKNQGLCISCGTTCSVQWHPCPTKDLPFVREEFIEKAKRSKRKPNQLCHKCFINLNRDEGPSVKKSDIKGAGNGLFAERDYKWGEIVCWYTGMSFFLIIFSLL